MPDSLVQLQQMFNVEALEEQLKNTSAKAEAVFNTDISSYTQRMEDVRDTIGQLAIALEIEDQARIRALHAEERPAMAIRLN